MIKPPLAAIFIMELAVMPLFNAGAQNVQSAATPGKTGGSNLKTAQAAIAEGNKAYKEKHYDVAVAEYQMACDWLPEAPIDHTLRGEAIEGFSQASVRLAEQRIAEGRLDDAKAMVKVVLDPKYNPNYKPAMELLAHLDDPDYYNPVTGPYSNTRKDVKTLLKEAKGFYDSARFDLAYKRYDQVLDLDPTNIAARRGQEEVNAAKLKYTTEANDEMRKTLRYPVVTSEMKSVAGKTKYISDKLRRIIIPKIDFKEITVREAVDFLREKSAELDTTEPDPARRGVNIVMEMEAFTADGLPFTDRDIGSTADAKITLSLTNISLAKALTAVTGTAGLLRYKVEPYAVVIVPLLTDEFATKEYIVPQRLLAGKDGRAQTARELLESLGVTFPAGANATYIPSGSRLVVRNSEENLDLVDQIVDAATPKTRISEYNTDYIQGKLDSLIIPKIEFKEATMFEVMEFLHKKSVELDAREPDPAKKGVNIALKPRLEGDTPAVVPKINLTLTNVPLSEALHYAAALAGMSLWVEPDRVTFVPLFSTEYIRNKLNRIIIPKIEFREATVSNAIEFLKRKSIELDTTEPDPAHRGVNIVLKLDAAPTAGNSPSASATPAAPAISPADAKLSLLLTNIPLAEALRYIANLAGLQVKVEPYAITIVPLSGADDPLVTKEYKVFPGFIKALDSVTGGDPDYSPRRNAAVGALENAGVLFPDGANANFLPSSSKLVVHNTGENLELVDQIVKTLIRDQSAAAAKSTPAPSPVPPKVNASPTPGNRVNVEKVKKLFAEAKGFYDSWHFDLAYKRYTQILDLDPYNIAAHKGQEEVNATRLKYTAEVSDEERNHISGPVAATGFNALVGLEAEYLQHKLTHIVIPAMEFKNATVTEAIKLLHEKSVELDAAETDPVLKGVNIVVKQDASRGAGDAAVPADAKINITLTNISVSEALHYIATHAGLQAKVDRYGVIVAPTAVPGDTPAAK